MGFYTSSTWSHFQGWSMITVTAEPKYHFHVCGPKNMSEKFNLMLANQKPVLHHFNVKEMPDPDKLFTWTFYWKTSVSCFTRLLHVIQSSNTTAWAIRAWQCVMYTHTSHTHSLWDTVEEFYPFNLHYTHTQVILWQTKEAIRTHCVWNRPYSLSESLREVYLYILL